MTILEIIEKKRVGIELDREELEFAFNGYLEHKVEDYQISSLLMAICINGMTIDETVILTDMMLKSGRELDISKISGVLVDKHSTGGVGDKTSLIIGPILACLGLKMGKLSGRGLGFTGGTIDKLESIPGFRISLDETAFLNNLNRVGFTITEQSDEFTPLDRVIYDLRNASGTVSSVPLIASSIMSKKLALGAKYILIDIKVGEGALLNDRDDAVDLANTMIEIGKKYGREVIPVLTDMDAPLGDNVGNALEILEVLDVLKGKTGDLRELCINLASVLYSRAKSVDIDRAKAAVLKVLDTGDAYRKFIEFVESRGGDLEKLAVAKFLKPVKAQKTGHLKEISALEIAKLSFELGAGRKTKGGEIDYGVGIVVNKHRGDYVREGETLCYIYQNDSLDRSDLARKAFTIED